MPTQADRLLVDLAVKNHLITKVEGDAALAELPAGTDAGAHLVARNLIKDRHLASLQKKLEKLLAEMGISPAQAGMGGGAPAAANSDATFVQPEATSAPLASSDAAVVLFGQIAVKMKYLVESDLERALRLQEQLAAQKTPMRLGAICVKARRMTEEQVREVLGFQEKWILTCATCGRRYNVSTSQQGALTCIACGGALAGSSSGITVSQTHPGAGAKLAPMPAAAGPTVAGTASGVQQSLGSSGALTTRKPPTPDDPAGLVGVTWQGYVVEKVLGKGGMGAVYKASHAHMRQTVALKVMLRTGAQAAPGERERFKREAVLVGNLKHFNIVRVMTAGWDGDLAWFTMEFIKGQDMKALLRSGASPIRRGAEIVAKCARAMDDAHKASVIHRDLKPQNIMIDEESGEPKVVDFGLAKQVVTVDSAANEEQQLTQMGAFLGTPSYMAPEQAGGDPNKIDRRADVYALGAILYEVLTGRPPFTGKKAIQVIRSVLKDEPVPCRQIFPQAPAELEAIALKALRKMPEERYQTAGQLADAIEAVIGKVSRNVMALPSVGPGGSTSGAGSPPASGPGTDTGSTGKKAGFMGRLFGGGS